jgi:chromosome segregation ATPase
MTTTTPALDHQPIHDCFGQWREEQETFDAELTETFSSLEDYQSHLDDWQRALADELEQLQHERKRLERDQAESQEHGAEIDSLSEKLNEARQQSSQLSKELLSRTDELRELDKKRAELATELELARARDSELTTALDNQKQWMDQQRLQWTEELKHLRELLEQRSTAAADTPRAESGNENITANGTPGEDDSDDEAPCADDSQTEGPWEDNPVLGSIVAQFGKLRKQRSAGRQKAN